MYKKEPKEKKKHGTIRISNLYSILKTEKEIYTF